MAGEQKSRQSLLRSLHENAPTYNKIAGDIAGASGREKRDAVKLRALTPEKFSAPRRLPAFEVPRPIQTNCLGALSLERIVPIDENSPREVAS